MITHTGAANTLFERDNMTVASSHTQNSIRSIRERIDREKDGKKEW